MTLTEKRAERAKLVQQMRAINDKAEKEKRNFSVEEDAEYRKLEAEVDRLGDEIKAEEERTTRAAKLTALQADLDRAPAPVTKPTPEGQPAPGARANPRATPEYRDAQNAYLRGGTTALQIHLQGLTAEQRQTLQVDVLTKGGALVPTQQFVAELIKGVDDAVFVRTYARKFQLAQAASLGVPSLDTDLDDLDWTAELLTGSLGTITLGKRELRPHPLAKRVKVSKTLDRVSAVPIDVLVRERLTYKLGVTQEKAYLTGDGVQKPLGVFVASADGIPTSRDVLTGSATDFTGDGLIDAKGAMKGQYYAQARWLFNRTGVTKIRKLKEPTTNIYLWQPGLVAGVPDTLLGMPVDVSEYVPNTFTTGLYVGMLAWWPAYWIVDSLDMTLQFLDQLYAEANQNGYIGRYEGDGQPVLAEGFVRLKTS
jgi:HK97 family phage major capsid protein